MSAQYRPSVESTEYTGSVILSDSQSIAKYNLTTMTGDHVEYFAIGAMMNPIRKVLRDREVR